MTESVNITVKVTAAKFPYSNRPAEKHNFIIADIMDKVSEESQHLDMDLTYVWCLNATNSLANMHGFHHFNLYLDKTPTHHLPLLTSHQHSFHMILVKFSDTLTALHRARQAFILTKSSAKI